MYVIPTCRGLVVYFILFWFNNDTNILDSCISYNSIFQIGSSSCMIGCNQLARLCLPVNQSLAIWIWRVSDFYSKDSRIMEPEV